MARVTRTIDGIPFVFMEHDGWSLITAIHDGITYAVKIRAKERDAFQELREADGGVHEALALSTCIVLSYGADVGRCCSIELYPRCQEFNPVRYSYTHKFLCP